MSENGKDRHAMQPITCNMPEELRNEKLAGWKRAVRCALAWAEE